ncbi:MAG: type II toxin-antitoxin system RelE/ParE family toxin [Candidatus Bathyarchaeia archaeon]
MPKYRVVFHRKAEKALDGFDKKTQQRLLEDILCLADFSERRSRLDIVRLEGMKGFYCLRSGRLRVIFAVDKPSGTIIILKIEQRERAYE